MNNRIQGLHHITAIARNAKRNYEFYTKVMGLRFVKKTVNFDDPGTYHFYFGDGTGSPGTILTFFPWEQIKKGMPGNGMATEIGYSVPEGSLEFWKNRFKEFQVSHQEVEERFGNRLLSFEDPDGLKLAMVETKGDNRVPWTVDDVSSQVAARGFHDITLTVRKMEPTAKILTDIFGYTLQSQEGNRHRFVTDAISIANVVDLVESPSGHDGIVAGGTNHHVAFRVKDDNVLMEFREKVESKGLHITPKIDRNYFFSLYFREPGGILFEIATDNPGFTVDEPLSELGTHLKLPAQYENSRAQIESILPVLQ